MCQETESLKTKLADIPSGIAHASTYQRAVLEILNCLFNPELIDSEMEVKTYEGTERRDILFTNDSDQSFWSYIRQEHSAVLLMFETKNRHFSFPVDVKQPFSGSISLGRGGVIL